MRKIYTLSCIFPVSKTPRPVFKRYERALQFSIYWQSYLTCVYENCVAGIFFSKVKHHSQKLLMEIQGWSNLKHLQQQKKYESKIESYRNGGKNCGKRSCWLQSVFTFPTLFLKVFILRVSRFCVKG